MDMTPILAAGAEPLDATPAAAKPWWHSTPAIYGLFVGGAALLLLQSLFGPSMLYDSFAISWVWADQFTAEIARGNLYPRWLPLSNSGLGASVFYYYPPLAFHLTALFGLLGASTYASIVWAFGASFALSGITAWHWLKDRSAHPILGALMFMAAPYHMFDYTRRGALAETVAIALLPLVALGLRRVAEGRGIVLAAVAYAAIIMTHLPLALLASVLLIAPYALRHYRRLPAFAAACALGLGLASIYLLPALALEPYHETAMLYREDFLNPGYWTPWNADLSNGFVITLFLVEAALAALAAILWIKRRDLWAAGALAVVLIAAGFVPGFWSLPVIEKVQFSYRALPIAELALITALARAELRGIVLAGLIPLTMLSASFQKQAASKDDPQLELLAAEHPDVSEYVPAGVIALEDRETRPRDLHKILLPPPHVPGNVVDPVFYFPAWSCGTIHEPTKLLMRDPACKPRIVWTREEWTGAALSLLSLLALALLAFRPGLIADMRLKLRRKA